MKSQLFKSKLQRGFTLIELVVVVGILGILISIVAPNVLGSKDGANAQLLLRSAANITQNWSLVNQACGTSTAVSGSPLPAATNTVSDVLFTGSADVAAAYTTCYGTAKVMALTEISQPNGAAGVYNIAGYKVTLAGGGGTPLSVTYNTVPDSLVLQMAQKYNPTLATLAASDSTSPVVQYGTATSGARNVTVLKQIN